MSKLPYRAHIVLFTVTRVVLNTMFRMVYPFLPVFGRGLRVDLASMSLALTLRSVAGCMGPFLATLADGLGRKAGMMLGLALFAVGALSVLLRPSFGGFILCLVLTVVGKYVYDPSIQAYLGDRVPYDRRGLVIALTEFGWSLSFIIGVPAAGYLIARGGWTAPFLPLALLGFGAVGIYARAIPKDSFTLRRRISPAANIRAVFLSAPALRGLAMGLAASAANEVINLVFGVWMEQSFGLQIAGLGAAAAAIGISELAGESLVGVMTDRMGKRRAIRTGLIFNCLAALLLPLLGVNLAGALLGLFLFYVSFEFTMVSMIPLMTEIFPAARATLLALNVAALSLGRALGAMLSSPLYALGIPANAFAAVAWNLIAWYFLRRIRAGAAA
ncbi:MAG: MFS transporter [Acidobacteria bacterium]|nr:MFS transporter [Acidobacteriota bacterium]